MWLGFNSLLLLFLTRESQWRYRRNPLIPPFVLFFLPLPPPFPLPSHRQKKERSPAPISGHHVCCQSGSRRQRTYRRQSTRRYAQCHPPPFPNLTSSKPQLCVHFSLSHVPRPLTLLPFSATQPTPALSVASSSNSPTLTSPTLASEDHLMESEEADFVGRLSTFPVVSTALRAYEQSKASSRVVKVCLHLYPRILSEHH